MKRFETGVIPNLSCPESLAPTSDVSMLDLSTLEGAPRVLVDASVSQKRGVGSSQFPFYNELIEFGKRVINYLSFFEEIDES